MITNRVRAGVLRPPHEAKLRYLHSISNLAFDLVGAGTGIIALERRVGLDFYPIVVLPERLAGPRPDTIDIGGNVGSAGRRVRPTEFVHEHARDSAS